MCITWVLRRSRRVLPGIRSWTRSSDTCARRAARLKGAGWARAFRWFANYFNCKQMGRCRRHGADCCADGGADGRSYRTIRTVLVRQIDYGQLVCGVVTATKLPAMVTPGAASETPRVVSKMVLAETVAALHSSSMPVARCASEL